jgi:leucyl aminopeptidase
LAGDLMAAGQAVSDPMWRMPLWRPYRRMIDSSVADINNVGGGAFGGAITAALYLQEFVPDDVPWAHFDTMAWNNTSRPGRPEGGEAQVARAIFAAIEKRISN